LADGRSVHHYFAYGLRIASEFPLPEFVPTVGREPADLQIRRATVFRPPLEPTSIRRLDIEAEFGGTSDSAVIHWPGVATIEAAKGCELRVDTEGPSDDPRRLSAYLVSEALGLVLCQRGLFLLHASSVAIAGEAVVFVGPPGAGKSTIAAACAQRGHTVIADDMVAIDFPGGSEQPVVLPGTGQLKAWPDTIRSLGHDPAMFARFVSGSPKRIAHYPAGLDLSPVPLRCVVFLIAATATTRAGVPPAEALMGLTRFFPCPSGVLSKVGRKLHFEHCRRVCDSTPAWKIERTEDFEELGKSVDWIEGHCRPAAATASSKGPRHASFADLLYPTTIEDFYENYYEKKPLHIHRRDVSYYADILSERDMDLFFQNHQIPSSTLRMTRNGEEIASARFSQAGNGALVDTAKLLDLYGEGNTIVVNSGDRSIPRLIQYRDRMERELECRLQFNLYVTPQGAQGFAAHYDDHDVFILQVSGRKNWRLFHSPVELPSTRQGHKKGTYELGAPKLTCELFPGDLLYIPRGVLHEAETKGFASIHVTFGLHPTYWFDLVRELATAAQDRPEFRGAVPNSLAGALRRLDFRIKFQALCQALVADVDIESLVDRQARERDRVAHPDNGGCFLDLARLEDVTLDTALRLRAPSRCEAGAAPKSIVILSRGAKLTLPSFLAKSVDGILERGAIVVREIGGLINDEGRVELARKLVRAGILAIESLARERAPSRAGFA